MCRNGGKGNGSGLPLKAGALVLLFLPCSVNIKERGHRAGGFYYHVYACLQMLPAIGVSSFKTALNSGKKTFSTHLNPDSIHMFSRCENNYRQIWGKVSVLGPMLFDAMRYSAQWIICHSGVATAQPTGDRLAWRFSRLSWSWWRNRSFVAYAQIFTIQLEMYEQIYGSDQRSACVSTGMCAF